MPKLKKQKADCLFGNIELGDSNEREERQVCPQDRQHHIVR